MNYNIMYNGSGNSYIQVGSAHDAMHTKEAHEIAQYEIQKARVKMVNEAAEAGRKEAEKRYNQLIDQLVAALPQEIETAVYLSFEQNKGLLLGETAQKMLSSHLADDLKASLDRLKITLG